jgi:hypothetical protein
MSIIIKKKKQCNPEVTRANSCAWCSLIRAETRFKHGRAPPLIILYLTYIVHTLNCDRLIAAFKSAETSTQYRGLIGQEKVKLVIGAVQASASQLAPRLQGRRYAECKIRAIGRSLY